MAKLKGDQTLFEVFSRQRRRQPAPPVVPEVVEAVEPEQAPPAEAEHEPEPEAPAQQEPDQPQVLPEARTSVWARIEGDTVRFSLNTLSMALLIFVVIAVVVAAFIAGKGVGYDGGWQDAVRRSELISGSEFERALVAEPSAAVLENLDQVNEAVLAEQARQRREERQGQTGFVDGLNYIWIERFNTRDEAEQAQAFLAANQINAVPVKHNGKWLLISEAGFDYQIPEDKRACQDLASRIRQAGRQYFDAGGRYRFECFAKKKLAEETW